MTSLALLNMFSVARLKKINCDEIWAVIELLQYTEKVNLTLTSSLKLVI